MSRPALEGEEYKKCQCGRRFLVQTWKTGIERKLCASCVTTYAKLKIYSAIEEMRSEIESKKFAS